MGSVQRDGDWHGGAGSQPSAVDPSQAEAVKEAKAFHLAVTTRVAVLYSAGLDRNQQR